MSKPDCWPDWLDDFWAKSPDPGSNPCREDRGLGRSSSVDGCQVHSGEARGESLAQHTWYVLERLAQIIRLRPTLPEDIGAPDLWRILFWACWLHDVGKIASGFQSRLRGGPRWVHRHEVLSLAFAKWATDAFAEPESMWLVAAIASHHRDADDLLAMYSDLADPEDDPVYHLMREMPEDAIGRLWQWFVECPASWINALGLHDYGIPLPQLPSREEAARMVRDQGPDDVRKWLQSYRSWLRKLRTSREHSMLIGTLALKGFLVSADHSASAHAGDLPSPVLPKPNELLANWQISETDLYEHQQASLRARGNVILMAPTGSGKTEAALLWATAQSRNGKPPPRLLYTLPFQASMNAMYDRLEKRGFAGQVGLEHSRSTLALYRRLLDEDRTPQEAARTARWHKQLARLNHFPVRILSPYQVLKAPYRLRGYECLLCDFFEATFVLDEVHAYEADRLALILATVKFLRENFGARFFVMSATLPALLEKYLGDALGEYERVQASRELYAVFRRHSLQLIDGELLETCWLEAMADEAVKGNSVLVCCNTVGHAQEAFDKLQSRLKDNMEVVLLHGRFNGRDRLAKEMAIISASGSKSSNRKPIVVVATQVVEVSLDIDLDLIYTEPAPLEALIQRFGRINRRRLKKLAPVNVFLRPDDGQRVYDAELVRRALGVLARRDREPIDEEDISGWLNEIYAGEAGATWERAYEESYTHFSRDCLDRLRAFRSDRSLEELFYQAFDSVEVLPVGLVEEYERLISRNEPLEASQLFVPIRWGQLSKLRNAGKVKELDSVKVVDAEYNGQFGLRLY